jgi:hypothetical protein
MEFIMDTVKVNLHPSDALDMKRVLDKAISEIENGSPDEALRIVTLARDKCLEIAKKP